MQSESVKTANVRWAISHRCVQCEKVFYHLCFDTHRQCQKCCLICCLLSEPCILRTECHPAKPGRDTILH